MCSVGVSSPKPLQRPDQGTVGSSSDSTEGCDGGGGTLWGDNKLLYINTKLYMPRSECPRMMSFDRSIFRSMLL